MSPLTCMLNRFDSWNNHETCLFKKNVVARAANILVITPLEVAAVVENVFSTSVYVASTFLKSFLKTASLLTNSKGLKNFQAKLPGFTDVLRSIARVVAYTLGTALTLTIGILSPKTNFEMHCTMGLTINKQQEAALTAMEEIEAAEEAKQNAQREMEKTEETEGLKQNESLSIAHG